MKKDGRKEARKQNKEREGRAVCERASCGRAGERAGRQRAQTEFPALFFSPKQARACEIDTRPARTDSPVQRTRV